MTPSIIKITADGENTFDLISEAFEYKRRIFLDRPIDDTAATEMILQLDYLARQSDDDITIFINSPGGSVSAGLAIVDAMKRCGCDIKTVCTGLAASMASVILACGTKGKRFATPYSEVLIHQPLISGGFGGQCTEVEIQAKHIMHSKKVLMELLAEQTGQTEEKVTADCERDSYLTSAEALGYGLVDRILEKEEL